MGQEVPAAHRGKRKTNGRAGGSHATTGALERKIEAQAKELKALKAKAGSARGQEVDRRQRSRSPKNVQQKKDKDNGGVDPKVYASFIRKNSFRKLFKNQAQDGKFPCHRFQSSKCTESSAQCRFGHFYAGCGGPKPYDTCLCMTDKIRAALGRN